MKKYLVAIVVACCGSAQAADYISISGFSYHTERHRSNGEKWNEVNPGMGFEHEWSEPWSLAAGIYRNSFDRTTVFAGVRWEPLRLGPVKFGVLAAAASGYPSPVVGALTADVRLSDRLSMTLLGAPNSGDSGGFLGIYARIRLGN